MEPKDLKNSKVELSDTLIVSETVNDQNVTEESVEQPEVIEVAEVEDAVEEFAEVPVSETVESIIQEAEEVIAPEISEIEAESAETEVVVQVEAIPEVEIAEVVTTADLEAAEVEIVTEPEVEPDQEEVEIKSIVDDIPTIEELIEVSEEDLEIHEDDLLEEDSPKLKMADYANLDEVELINELRNLLQNDDFDRIRDDVDAIKINFFRRYRANIEAQKVAFTEAGGDIAEFKAEPDPSELDLRNLLKQYQDIRNEHNKKADESKESNLQKKYEIIEEIKALINNKESINKTFHDFRDLQDKWRNIGPVPQAKLKDL